MSGVMTFSHHDIVRLLGREAARRLGLEGEISTSYPGTWNQKPPGFSVVIACAKGHGNPEAQKLRERHDRERNDSGQGDKGDG